MGWPKCPEDLLPLKYFGLGGGYHKTILIICRHVTRQLVLKYEFGKMDMEGTASYLTEITQIFN